MHTEIFIRSHHGGKQKLTVFIHSSIVSASTDRSTAQPLVYALSVEQDYSYTKIKWTNRQLYDPTSIGSICCTINPQQIEALEFEPKRAHSKFYVSWAAVPSAMCPSEERWHHSSHLISSMSDLIYISVKCLCRETQFAVALSNRNKVGRAVLLHAFGYTVSGARSVLLADLNLPFLLLCSAWTENSDTRFKS